MKALMYGPIHQLDNIGHALRISFGPMNAPKAMKIFAKLQTQPIYYSAYVVYALLQSMGLNLEPSHILRSLVCAVEMKGTNTLAIFGSAVWNSKV